MFETYAKIYKVDQNFHECLSYGILPCEMHKLNITSFMLKQRCFLIKCFFFEGQL